MGFTRIQILGVSFDVDNGSNNKDYDYDTMLKYKEEEED